LSSWLTRKLEALGLSPRLRSRLDGPEAAVDAAAAAAGVLLERGVAARAAAVAPAPAAKQPTPFPGPRRQEAVAAPDVDTRRRGIGHVPWLAARTFSTLQVPVSDSAWSAKVNIRI
jgi:hypothetical protein